MSIYDEDTSQCVSMNDSISKFEFDFENDSNFSDINMTSYDQDAIYISDDNGTIEGVSCYSNVNLEVEST